MPRSSGTSLGGYEILSLLGVGGMGEVYRARDRKLGREVALKVLPEEFGRDAARVSRFEREARLLASVNHHGIAAIYGAEESGDTRYLVLELVTGTTLSERMKGVMAPADALRIARQIAEALEAAHERGIIHRDLKPANVMVTPEGRVKLLDLGLAKLMSAPRTGLDGLSHELTAPLEDTRPGVILGTVEFMSPEQARGKAIDKRTDIWAFGCILFELFSGRRAFAGESVSDAIASILLREPDWTALPADTPPPIRELLQRCLQKDASQRLRDIGDARLAIDELLATMDPRRSSASGVFAAPPKRRTISASRVVAGVAAVLAIAAGAFLLSRAKRPVASPENRLMAILPFRDLSNVPDGGLLGEGLVETVSARIGGATGVQVVSPAAAVAASRGESDPLKAARSLGASVLLRGSVQRSGDRVRITYSIWDVGRGAELAGGTLDGAASDLFELQDRLVARVSERESLPMIGRAMPPSGLASGDEQERYLKAVGLLQRYNTKASVDEARGLLETLSRQAQRSPYVFASLARAYLETFDLTHDAAAVAKAESAAGRARELGPTLAEVDVTLGEVRLHSGNAAGAIEAFRQALSASPSSFEARLGLARALAAAGNDVEAEKAFRQAIDLQPTYWGGWSKLAGFYYGQGRYGEAATAFRRVTEMTPESAMAFSNLGGTEVLAGNLTDARAAFQRSLSLAATDSAYANLGTAEFFLGNFAKAAAAFDAAVRITPDHYELWSNLGDARRWAPGLRPRAAEAYARAIELARKELAVNPRQAMVHSILALCLVKTGAVPEALEHASQAVLLDGKNPEILYNVGIVSNLAGRTEEAVDRLGRAAASGYSRAFIDHEPEIANLRSAGKLRF
jgi:tetratricopeptide (TPR) repeat protein